MLITELILFRKSMEGDNIVEINIIKWEKWQNMLVWETIHITLYCVSCEDVFQTEINKTLEEVLEELIGLGSISEGMDWQTDYC